MKKVVSLGALAFTLTLANFSVTAGDIEKAKLCQDNVPPVMVRRGSAPVLCGLTWPVRKPLTWKNS